MIIFLRGIWPAESHEYAILNLMAILFGYTCFWLQISLDKCLRVWFLTLKSQSELTESNKQHDYGCTACMKKHSLHNLENYLELLYTFIPPKVAYWKPVFLTGSCYMHFGWKCVAFKCLCYTNDSITAPFKCLSSDNIFLQGREGRMKLTLANSLYSQHLYYDFLLKLLSSL